ncbi:MAG: hypothetical protein IJW61_02440, partial [Clostridia bacterium]|nr:hypothetical protein [Clostridia bacterium]
MKKTVILLLLVCLTICGCFGLSSCGEKDDSGDDNSEKTIVNTQFVEYSTAAVTVISDINAIARLEKTVSLVNELEASPMSYRQTISDDDTKLVYEEAFGLAQYVTEQGLGLPLVCGDIGSEYFELTEFYGITFFIEGHDLAIKTVKIGNAYFTYAYNSASNIFLVNKLVYNSKNDYEVTYYEKNNSGYTYVYLDSDLKGYGYIDNTEMNEVYYIDLKDVSYVSKEETILDEMKSMCENEIASNDFSEQKSGIVGAQSNYSITPDQFHSSFNKYINWGGMVYSEDGFIVDSETGYLLGYETDDPSVTAIRIPEAYDTLNGFYINAPNVKTVFIPNTVKHIKISKASLKFKQTGEDGTSEEREIYVDCPIEFFDISHSSYYFNGLDEQPTLMSIERFEVEEGSPLFSEKDGSLYSKDGNVLLYLADNPNVTNLVITADRLTSGAIDILYTNVSNLESIEYNADMTYIEQGNTYNFDLLSEIIGGLRDNAERTGISGPTVEIASVTINKISSDVSENGNTIIGKVMNSVANYDCERVKIGRLVLNGDFSEIYIEDCVNFGSSYSGQIIEDITVNSTDPNCVVSGILSIEELTIYKDYAEGELQIEYPKLKKLTIAEGVETVYLSDISGQENTFEVWLPSTIKNYRCNTYANVIYHIAMNPLEFEYLKKLNQISIDGLPNEDADAWKTNVIFEMDKTEEQKLLDFKRYTINTEEPTLSIQGYYGTSEILVIPESIYGFTVTWYNSYASTDTPLSASQIKEVHLPKSLEGFGIDYDWRLDKIVYDGTVEEFEELYPSESLFKEGITLIIECSDGTISPDTLPIYYFDDTALVCELDGKSVIFNIENMCVTAEKENGLYLLTGKFEGVELSQQIQVSQD